MPSTRVNIACLRLLAAWFLASCFASPAAAQTTLSLSASSLKFATVVSNPTCLACIDNRIVVGSLDGKLRIYSPQGNQYQLSKQFQDLARHQSFSARAGGILSLAVYEDRSLTAKNRILIATGGVDLTARVWSLEQSNKIQLPSAGTVGALAASNDDTLVAAAIGNQVNTWKSANDFANDGGKIRINTLGAIAGVPPNKPAVQSIVWRKKGSTQAPMAGLEDGSIAYWGAYDDAQPASRIETPSVNGALALFVPPSAASSSSSPGLKEIIGSIGNDGVVRTWDLSAQAPKLAAENLPATFDAFALSGDGTKLAIASGANFSLWSVSESTTSTVTLSKLTPDSEPSADNPIQLLALDSSGTTLAVVDTSSNVYRYAKVGQADEISTKLGQLQATDGTTIGITSLAISACGKQLAVAGVDRATRLFDFSGSGTPRPVTVSQQAYRVCRVAFLGSDSHWLAIASGRTLDISNVEHTLRPAAKSVPLVLPDQITAFDAPTDGSFLFVGTAAGKLYVYPLSAAAQPWEGSAWPAANRVLRVSDRKITSLEARTDKRLRLRLVSSASDGKIQLWDFTKPRQTNPAVLQRQIFSKDSQPDRAWVLNRGDTILSVTAGKQPTLDRAVAIDVEAIPQAAQYNVKTLDPEGDRLILVGGPDRKTIGMVFNRDHTATSPTTPFGYTHRYTLSGQTSNITCLAPTRDGQHIVTGSADNAVRCWSFDDGSLEATVPFAKPPTALVAGADGIIFAKLDDHTWQTVDVGGLELPKPTGVTAAAFALGTDQDNTASDAIAILTSRSRLLVGTTDSRALSINIGPMASFGSQPLAALTKRDAAARPPLLHRGPIYAVAFSPEGKHLATAAADGIVRWFRLTSGTDTLPSRQWCYDDTEAALTSIDIDDNYASAAYGVAFTQSGGSAIALGSALGYLASWDLTQSATKPKWLYPKPDSAAKSPVYCLAANCAGTKLAFGCQDGTLAVLDVATKNVLYSQKHTAAIVSIALHPKLDNVVAIVDWQLDATQSVQQNLVVWDLSTSTPAVTEHDCCAAAWQKASPLRIVVAGQGGNIRLLDVGP